MARLEIEVGGENKEFKSTVRESLTILEDFKKAAEGIKIEMFGATTAKELQTLEKSLASVSTALKTFTADANKGSTAVNSNLKTAITELKVSEQELKNEYAKSRAEITKYSLEQKKLIDSTRAEAAATKQAETAQRSILAERKRGEAEARRLAALLEKNRKQVMKESSEYYKLSTALGNLRKEAKDTLAAMFRLESQGKKNTAAYQELANKARGLTAQTTFLDTGIKKIDASLGLHQRNVGNYGNALSALSPTFSRIHSQLAMMGVDLESVSAKGTSGFSQLGVSIVGVGRSIGTFLISPIGLAITALGALFALFRSGAPTVKAFDSGLLNVAKTTGISGQELNGLSDAIIGLSRELKTVSTDKLLQYATVAGQLGVKGAQNILNFSEALAKLETASDITGEAGGAEIARLLTLTDGGVQNIKDFGDEIVNLGNNFAATEKEILGNAESIAQNTGIYKVGRQDVLAYAVATKSVGLEAEVVGSAIFRTLAQIEKFSQGAKGSENILKLLGVTQKELSTQFNDSSANVLTKFVTALNGVDQAGGSVNATLRELGLINVRDIRVLGTLATSGYGQLQQAMVDVREAGGALQREFETASGKLVNQTGRIGIAWDNLVLSVENGTGAIGVATVAVVGFFADALESITNLVSSRSWSEFFTRIDRLGQGEQINYEIQFRDIEAANQAIRKLDKSSSDFIKKHNFAKLGAAGFNKELEKASTSYEVAAKASREFEAAVITGRFNESKVTANQFKIQESIARAHFLELQKLQKELGFAPVAAAAVQDDVAAEAASEKALKVQESARKKLEDAVTDSNNRVALAATEDRARDLERVRIYYEEKSKLAKGNGTALATLQENRRSEEAAVNAKWDAKDVEDRQKTEDEINKILADAGISRIKSRQQELDQSTAKYDALVAKYRDNASALLAVDEARGAAAAAINEKWNAEETNVAIQYSRRLNESKTQLLIRQLNEETKRKEKAAQGDNAMLLNLQDDYYKRIEELYAVDRKNQVALAFDGTALSMGLEAINQEIKEVKRQFELTGGSIEVFKAKITALETSRGQLGVLKNGIESVGDAAGGLASDLLFLGEDAFDNLGKAFTSLASSIISDLIRIQAVKAIGNLLTGGIFGGLGGLLGFAKGGYTGNVGTNQVAGVVHGQEMVINAAATQRHRGLLESINSGRFSAGTAVSQSSVDPNGGKVVVVGETRIDKGDIVISYRQGSKEIDRYGS